MLNTEESVLVLVDFQERLAEIVLRRAGCTQCSAVNQSCQALGVPIYPPYRCLKNWVPCRQNWSRCWAM